LRDINLPRPKSVELGLEERIGVVERFYSPDGLIDINIGQPSGSLACVNMTGAAWPSPVGLLFVSVQA
jgi:hypothetical protein